MKALVDYLYGGNYHKIDPWSRQGNVLIFAEKHDFKNLQDELKAHTQDEKVLILDETASHMEQLAQTQRLEDKE